MRSQAHVELPLDGAVVREERKKAVCRGRGNHLEGAALGKMPKSEEEALSLAPFEVAEELRIELFPPHGEIGGMRVAERGKPPTIFAGGLGALLEVLDEA